MKQWKDIPGYEGIYQISNAGNIKRISRARGAIVGYEFRPIADKKGYLKTRLTNANGVAKTVKVHRLVAITFIPNPENKKAVNHKNTIKADNHVDNLEWCTDSENMRHAVANGLVRGGMKGRFGKDHNKSVKIKMKNIDTGEIREFHGIEEAARQLKTNSAAIWRTKTGIYKHTKRWTYSS